MTTTKNKPKKPTVSEYSENNLLIVPQSLYHMTDVKALLHDADSVIFYKDLTEELIDIEFHTNAPCIVYIKSGQESITSAENQAFHLKPKDLIFFPKGINLHSDYRSQDGRLNAFLIFFNQAVIDEFLAQKKPSNLTKTSEAFQLDSNNLYDVFFESLLKSAPLLNNSKTVLKYKLLELLNLIDLQDTGGRLRNNLIHVTKASTKRNIIRLMNQHAHGHLSVSDLAALSGRSIATFNRDFKKHYQTSPKQWLIEKRLEFAHTLLMETSQSVTEIATQIGYDNLSHFTKAFKSRYQHTPNEIKNKI